MYTSLSPFIDQLIEDVLQLEKIRRELGRQILFTRNRQERQKLIYTFLSYELDKHEIMADIALITISENKSMILAQLECYYQHIQGEDLLEKIDGEIKQIRSYLQLIHRSIHAVSSLSFAERRILQELNKYILVQARCIGQIR